MIFDRTDKTQLQRSIWGHQQTAIHLSLVDAIDDGLYDQVKDVIHPIDNAIEEELNSGI